MRTSYPSVDKEPVIGPYRIVTSCLGRQYIPFSC